MTSPPLAAWLLLVAFGIKAGLFPLYIWLPGAYHVPTPVVSAVFAALLTKVGVYALIRTTALYFPAQGELLQQILVIAGLATMISGALGALAQQELRRILAFHVVSQVGYMVVAVGLGTAAALAAALVYIVHHIVVKGQPLLSWWLSVRTWRNRKIKTPWRHDGNQTLAGCAVFNCRTQSCRRATILRFHWEAGGCPSWLCC